MKKIYFALVLALAGCVSHYEYPQEGSSEKPNNPNISFDFTEEELRFLPVITCGTNSMSKDDVVQRAEEVIDLLYESEAATTRSSTGWSPNNRRLASISPIMAPRTRTRGSNQADTLFYVCNFADSLGYTIISADSRVLNPVLAIVGSGSFDGRATDNPGFQLFLSMVNDYIAESVDDFESKRDSISRVIIEKLNSGVPNTDVAMVKTRSSEGGSGGGPALQDVPYVSKIDVYVEYDVIAKKTPMVPVEWGQNAPYNDIVSQNYGQNVPVGCVATAAAQIMAYWKYPTNIEGYTFDWDRLNQYSGSAFRSGRYKNWVNYMSLAPSDVKVSVARLMEKIGEPERLHMNYAIGSSGAATLNVCKMLDELGYSSVDTSFQSYNYEVVKNALKSNRPVLIEGWTPNHDAGHAWVIDGYVERKQMIVVDVMTTWLVSGNVEHDIVREHVSTQSLIHNNWGADGRYNGFFEQGCFAINEKFADSNLIKSRQTTTPDYDFGYEIKIFPNIKR